MEEYKMKNSALVVIDLQNDITKNYKEIIAKVNEAIDWAEQQGLWIVYIQHNSLSAGTRTFKPGTHQLLQTTPLLHFQIQKTSENNILVFLHTSQTKSFLDL